MLKRIMLALTVALVMATMMVATAAPAFATGPFDTAICPEGDRPAGAVPVNTDTEIGPDAVIHTCLNGWQPPVTS